MKKYIIILLASMLMITNPSMIQAATQCPGFTCPAGKQCQKNLDNSYFCADCPKDASGNPLCATNDSTDGATAVGGVFPPSPVDTSPNAIWNYVPTGLTAAYFIALLMVLGFIIYGGIKWITAGGDPKAIAAAMATITQAVVGLILLSVAFIITQILQSWLNPSSGRTIADGTVVYTYICGNGASNVSEWRNFCQTQSPRGPITASQWNAQDPDTRSKRCVSRAECDSGCVKNDQLRREYQRTGNPADPYVYCRQ